MITKIETIEEAREYRYGTWSGNPNGRTYKEGYCAYEIWESGPWIMSCQCSRKNGYGPDGLYCKQHAKKLI